MREAGIQAYAEKPIGQAELFDAVSIAVARDALGRARSALVQTSRRERRREGAVQFANSFTHSESVCPKAVFALPTGRCVSIQCDPDDKGTPVRKPGSQSFRSTAFGP